MPSVFSYVEGFHKLVCKEIELAIVEMKEKGHEIYPPTQITYNYGDDYAFTLSFENVIKQEDELPLATLDVMEHNARHK
jgi:hypothetical protein